MTEREWTDEEIAAIEASGDEDWGEPVEVVTLSDGVGMQLSVRFSRQEVDSVLDRARAFGMSPLDYVRAAALGTLPVAVSGD